MTQDVDCYQQGREKHVPLDNKYLSFGRDYAENWRDKHTFWMGFTRAYHSIHSSNGSGWKQHGRQPQRWHHKEI